MTYIGETENNLKPVFDAVEPDNAIPPFKELGCSGRPARLNHNVWWQGLTLIVVYDPYTVILQPCNRCVVTTSPSWTGPQCLGSPQRKYLLTDLLQHSRFERFQNIISGPHANGLLKDPVIRTGRHHQDRDSGVPSAELPEDLDAIHDGHMNVQKHPIERQASRFKGHQGQSGPSIVSDDDFMAHCLEAIFQGFAYVRLVIDDEQPVLHVVVPWPRVHSWLIGRI